MEHEVFLQESTIGSEHVTLGTDHGTDSFKELGYPFRDSPMWLFPDRRQYILHGTDIVGESFDSGFIWK